MRDRLFHVRPDQASKYAQVVPGRQFFLLPILASAASFHFPETCWLLPHRSPRYHQDRRLTPPNGKDPFLHKKADEYKLEQIPGNQMHLQTMVLCTGANIVAIIEGNGAM